MDARSSSMIAWKDVLPMPDVGGPSNQHIRRGSAAVAAARSFLSARMPGAVQDAAGPSSAGTRPQGLAAERIAIDTHEIEETPLERVSAAGL